jgi:hypothetical protein
MRFFLMKPQLFGWSVIFGQIRTVELAMNVSIG